MAEQGLVSRQSQFSVTETIDRLAAAAQQAGLVVFARVDHAKNATDVGMDLWPTELLVFGNPRGGTPLMAERQTSGIDLPVKALAWEDESGRVWLTCNGAEWPATREGSTATEETPSRATTAFVRPAGRPADEPWARAAHAPSAAARRVGTASLAA